MEPTYGNSSIILPNEVPKYGLPTPDTNWLAAVGEMSAMGSRRLNLQGKARNLKGECQPPVSSERALKYRSVFEKNLVDSLFQKVLLGRVLVSCY